MLLQQPGEPIRGLVKDRLRKSNNYIWLAAFAGIGCCALLLIFGGEQQSSLLSWWNFFYKAGIAIVLILFLLAAHWLKRAGHAEKGAQGEELLLKFLRDLYDNKGWRVEFNVRIPGLNGDIDHVAVSPSGLVVAIDMKNHNISQYFSAFDDIRLNRLTGAVARQAIALRNVRNIKQWVEGVLCFTENNHYLHGEKWHKHRQVYVTSAENIRELLLHLDDERNSARAFFI